MILRLRMAWHVLRGRPLMYGFSLTLAEPIVMPRNAFIVGNGIKQNGLRIS